MKRFREMNVEDGDTQDERRPGKQWLSRHESPKKDLKEDR
jgi:hypothetical protein